MNRSFPILIFLLLHSSLLAAARPNPREGYLGDDACKSCHADQFDSYHHTAHYLTSTLPTQHTVLGNFTPGNNLLKTANPNLSFRMDSHDGGFFQTAVAPTSSRSERFAFVIGSGDKGQTYLFWDEDQLFQLPISYWTDLGWVNSPGYRDGFADFERPIIPRCLDCHATYFESLRRPPTATPTQTSPWAFSAKSVTAREGNT
jgi:hypothetical protein